jgi:DNA invertase Pin-like site-specific DNA recombinase
LYARISSAEQRKGGGLERQTSADTAEFCGRFKFTLAKRVWTDDGVSAFHGLNATPDHDLGKFLIEARKGKFRPGDCLLVENYDRISRLDPWAAIGLVSELRQLQIHVGRLDRMRLLRHDSTDPGDFFEAAVGFTRAHSESAAKSMRNREAWKQKREAAREGAAMRPRKKDGRVTKGMTDRLPAWVEEKNGELHLIGPAVDTLKRVFELAAAGYGQARLVRKLVEEGVKPFGHRTAARRGKRKGDPEKWSRGYVGKLLKDRRVLGELQPRKADRSKAGPPIKNYYPAAIDKALFKAARAGCADRKLRRGAVGKHVNVFSGLVVSALDGESYSCTASLGPGQRGKRPWQRVLKNTASIQGRAKCRTFPFATFEAACLSLLREIDPAELLSAAGPDPVKVLEAEKKRVDAELAEAVAFMRGRFSVAIGERVTELEARQAELQEQIDAAEARSPDRLDGALLAAHTLIDAVAEAPDPDDARVRLRSALRRVVDSIQLLVVVRGTARLAVAQFHFAGGRRRDLVILHRAGCGNASAKRPSSWAAWSAASDAGWTADLRDRGQAGCLAELLREVPLDVLSEHPFALLRTDGKVVVKEGKTRTLTIRTLGGGRETVQRPGIVVEHFYPVAPRVERAEG